MSKISPTKEQLNLLNNKFLDPQATELAKQVKWLYLKGISKTNNDLYPVAIVGEGKPILLLHGFDSSFLEYRRLVPFLKNKNKLIIPDLFGFGFCPRPYTNDYGLESILNHLNILLNEISKKSQTTVIGASMGGAIAMELARRKNNQIDKILLLSPAGIANKQKVIPWPLNEVGALFLKQSFVRRSLCKQAFANPRKDVRKPEEQIASAHLKVPGWQRSLASFALNGGISYNTKPLPSQSINVLWGSQDRIIKKNERKKCMSFLKKELNEIKNCGHLPHLDKPKVVAKYLQKII